MSLEVRDGSRQIWRRSPQTCNWSVRRESRSGKPARERTQSRSVSRKEIKTDIAQKVIHRRLQQQCFQQEPIFGKGQLSKQAEGCATFAADGGAIMSAAARNAIAILRRRPIMIPSSKEFQWDFFIAHAGPVAGEGVAEVIGELEEPQPGGQSPYSILKTGEKLQELHLDATQMNEEPEYLPTRGIMGENYDLRNYGSISSRS